MTAPARLSRTALIELIAEDQASRYRAMGDTDPWDRLLADARVWVREQGPNRFYLALLAENRGLIPRGQAKIEGEHLARVQRTRRFRAHPPCCEVCAKPGPKLCERCRLQDQDLDGREYTRD